MTIRNGPNLAYVLGKLRRAPWMPPGAKPACTGNWAPFDALIDTPGSRYSGQIVDTILAMCEICPIRETCWQENADEPWLRTVAHVLKIRARRPAASRRHCGSITGANAHYRRHERTCAACKKAVAAKSQAARARRKTGDAA